MRTFHVERPIADGLLVPDSREVAEFTSERWKFHCETLSLVTEYL